MRFIDNRQLVTTPEWDQRASDALADVDAGRCKVNDRSQVWRDQKDALAVLSSDKCWYCEAKQERSDDAVDHFRPKNRVAEATNPHSGYIWLAFNKNNYRYSCTFCNSKRKNPDTGVTQGKGDSFPLIDEANRGYVPGAEANEDPALLDPCNAMDPGCIDFRANGEPCPKYQDGSFRQLKADSSIDKYHLDHPDANEERRNLAIELDSWIDEADGLYAELNNTTQAVKNAFSGRCRDIINAMGAKAKYSAFARRIVAGRRDLEWVEDLFQTT